MRGAYIQSLDRHYNGRRATTSFLPGTLGQASAAPFPRFLHDCVSFESAIISVNKQTIHHNTFNRFLLIYLSLFSLLYTEKKTSRHWISTILVMLYHRKKTHNHSIPISDSNFKLSLAMIPASSCSEKNLNMYSLMILRASPPAFICLFPYYFSANIPNIALSRARIQKITSSLLAKMR